MEPTISQADSWSEETPKKLGSEPEKVQEPVVSYIVSLMEIRMKIVAVLLTGVCALNFGFAGPSEAKQVTASSPPSDIRKVIDYVDSLPSLNAEQLVMKAKAFYWLKDYSSAIVAISKSIALKPDPESYLSRALYAAGLKKYEEALKDCDKSEELGYRGSDLYALRGLIQLNLEDFAGL